MPVRLLIKKLGAGESSSLQCRYGASMGFSSGVSAVIRSVSLRQMWRLADDPQLAEFLRLMQPRRAGAIWSNEDAELAKHSSRAAAEPRAAGKQQAGGRVAAGLETSLQPTGHDVSASRSRAAAAQLHHEAAAEGEKGYRACTDPCLMFSI